jgi:N-acetylmuramoyl-L-alanine amidase
MKAGRRQALQGLGAIALSLGSVELAWGAAIVAVRVWPAQDWIGRAHV